MNRGQLENILYSNLDCELWATDCIGGPATELTGRCVFFIPEG
jgi:hypothetical protein